jgi:hypothetical protein
MRIAIAVRSFEQRAREAAASAAGADECFTEFEVNGLERNRSEDERADDEDVQVTVVLRGKRGELENPARGMTELVLRALEARRDARRSSDVIDVAGVAVEPAHATG